MLRCTNAVPWSYGPGAPGEPGAVRTEPIPVGKTGANGQISRELVHEHTLSLRLSPPFVTMLLNAVSRDYLNLDLDSAIERLNWLAAHLPPLSRPAQYAKSKRLSSRAFPRSPDERYYAACEQRVACLLRQLELGQDFYGEPSNYVTLLSEATYRAALDAMLALAASIEKAYLAYDANQALTTEVSNGLMQAKNKFVQALEVKRAEKAKLTAALPGLLETLGALDDERSALWTETQKANAEFQRAVRRRGAGCNFEQLVAIAAACSTLVASGGTAVAALSVASNVFSKKPTFANGNLIEPPTPLVTAPPAPAPPSGAPPRPPAPPSPHSPGQPISDDLTGFKYRIKAVVAAGSSTQDFVSAVGALGGLLEPKEQGPKAPALPTDEAKILATAESIQNQLQPFLDLPEAVAYRDTLQRYVDTCTARNNKVIEYNVQLNRLQQLDADLAQGQLESDRVQDTLAGTQQPAVAELATFMEHAWQDSLATVVRTLSRVHAAYKYYSLDDDAKLPLNDFSVDALNYSSLLVLKRYVEAKASFGVAPANIKGLRIPLVPLFGAEGLRALQRNGGGSVTFSLPPQHPDFIRMSHVLVSSFQVALSTSQGPERDFDVTLSHHGRGLIYDEAGKAHLYSHVPVRMPFRRQAGQPVVEQPVGSDDYVGLSPYGPWTLTLNRREGRRPLTDVSLLVSGFGRARRVRS